MAHGALAEIISILVRESNARFTDMTRALKTLENDPGDVSALANLMRRFHSFAGVGGLDGFEIINTLGARGEAECRRMLTESSLPTLEQLRRWASLVDVMKSEIDEAERSVEPALPVSTPTGIPRRRIYDVLLVEDDRATHAVLAARLSEEGFTVNSAYTYEEAIAYLAVYRPHALIVDIELPDGSGYGVIEQLRGASGNSDCTVMIITRRVAFLDRVEGIRFGADEWFTKPLDEERLVRRVRALVQSRDISVARILSVEDDPDQAAYLRSVLESAGYTVRACSDPQRFESELTGFAPDLILMDILLPDVSGYELARFARQHEEHQTTPILFLTTEGELHTRIQAIRSGGDDHIVKPVSPSLLLAAVETRIDRARQLRHSLDCDSLTGLLNRGAFLRRVQSRIRRDADSPASLVMLDVDRFKVLNDTYGHSFGDHVLARLASFLRTHVRASDSVCRYGGEEFTMLIDDVTEADAVRLVDRLREDFASVGHVVSMKETVFVTFSAGVVSLPERVSAMPQVLESADAALYRAKAEGRNRVCGVAGQFPASISA